MTVDKEEKKVMGCPKRQPSAKEIEATRQLTQIGFGTQALADEFHVSTPTIYRWKEEIPEFRLALEEGRSARRKRAHTCMYMQAFPVDENGKPTLKGNPDLMKFWMKTQERWKEAEKNIRVTADAALTTPLVQLVLKGTREEKASLNAETIGEHCEQKPEADDND